jgi:hypothetical protein
MISPNKMKTLDSGELPPWLTKYPPEYLSLIEKNLLIFSPWYLLDETLVKIRNEGLKQRFPQQELFAFAARQDNDDIACWRSDNPKKVFILHDFSSESNASRAEFSSFWEWFRSAINDMIEFEN